MQIRYLLWLPTLVLLVSSVAGCTSADEVGCTTDLECNGDRICNASGECMSPVRSAPTNPNASDASDAPDTQQVPDANSGPDADFGDAAADSNDASDTPDAPELDAGIDADAADQPDAADCPVARIRASIAAENDWYRSTLPTQPEETIELSAGQSSGNITHYEWTILDRPWDSTQRLTPDNISESTRLFVDQPGAYRVQLTAYDTSGASICDSSTSLTILATLDADLVVTLLWDTPNDPDQTDSAGTDLDLHYLHETGDWEDWEWDTFYRNPRPRWGDFDDRSDDPSLDIDDTDGAGPESVSHSGLEEVTYSVGAYYSSDSGLGASYATVQIYVNGQLTYEKRNEFIPRTGYFWHVADIEDQGATITEVNALTDGFPDSP